MKSTMQAAWLLTNAFGNAIVVIVAAGQFFSSQVRSELPLNYWHYLIKIFQILSGA